jgi:hypothetical protein
MKLDPVIHIVIHSVLFLKPGVTEVVSEHGTCMNRPVAVTSSVKFDLYDASPW